MTNDRQSKWNTYYHGIENDFSYSCNYCGYGAPYQIIGVIVRIAVH